MPEDYNIHEIAVFGREIHPEYFGTFSVPQLTPWGYTLKYKILTNGLYWIETDTCQIVLAVCYPMQDTFSSDALRLSRLTEYDAGHGLNSTFGYRFFAEKDSCIPLFELLEPRADWQDCINKAALMNAIFQYHPEYAMKYNIHEAQGLHDHLGQLINIMYGDYEPQGSIEHVISVCEQAGTKFLEF